MPQTLLRPLWITALLWLGLIPAHAETVAVAARPLSELAVFPELRAPATVLSLNQSRISAELAARLVALPIRVGETVAAGTLLARLDDKDFQLALARAEAGAKVLEAKRELAEYELQRARSLSQKQAVSEQLLKQREAEVKTLQAEQENQRLAIAQARRILEKTEVRAPFHAIITARIAQLGELAAPGSPLLELVDAEQLEVSARIQAHLANTLKQSDSLELLSNGKRYPLRLRVLTPHVEERSQTREARLSFSGQAALPGSAGELLWQNAQAHIPAELLLRRDGKLGVFVADHNHARFIELANAQEGRPTINSLSPDSLLVTEGRFQLRDGDAITLQ